MRGFVLLAIFANHIPGNLIEDVTPRNFGFSDAAEAFIFLSGLSVALCWGNREPGQILRRCLSRAFTLYRTHLALSFAAVGLFALVAVGADMPQLLTPDGRGAIFDDTARGIVGLFVLGHQLGYFNILPLYVLLMAWAPVPLLLARVHGGLALLLATVIYAASRREGLTLPTWPEPGTWFFNPFAWQLVFTLGIVAGCRPRRRPLPAPVFAASAMALVLSLFILKDGFGSAPGLWDAFRVRFDVIKQDAGLVRLLHFLALAVVVTQLRIAPALAETAVGREFQRLGRHSLPVFVAGSLISAGGQVVMTIVEVRSSGSPALAGLIYTALGMGGLVILARSLEWPWQVAGSSPASAPIFAPPFAAPSRSSPRP